MKTNISKILTDALDAAHSKFHGLRAAVTMHLKGDGQLDLEGLAKSLQEGQEITLGALEQSPDWKYYRGPDLAVPKEVTVEIKVPEGTEAVAVEIMAETLTQVGLVYDYDEVSPPVNGEVTIKAVGIVPIKQCEEI